MAAISRILMDISSHKNKFALFAAAPLCQFFSLNWSFLPLMAGHHLMAIKLRQPLAKSLLKISHLAELQYGKLYQLYSDTLLIGYLLDLPKLNISAIQEMIVVAPKRVQIDKLDDNCEVILKSPDLTVYVLDDAVQVAATINNSLMPPMF